MRCLSCGTENMHGSRFCDACGRAMPAASVARAPRPAAPPSPASTSGGGVNGLAIASMVLGILWLYWVGSILAVIFGHVSLSQINRTGQGGKGFAIAGVALGWVGVGTLVVFLLVAVAAVGSA